ncbi:8-oxo-dGTP pyrophosphatase MutT (NUDIX family) [Arthrobacter stackebrandtii]|uniref:8-oxo-dGTP pyrophosphatase MutT (NUDIX family) n=1 Tax=Arthrobacter stackebrandtii TaxID=272161 RepID=A0ABS4Z2P8_9MICC|nr:hypothetical protein [Arthrobacter stackebrandtii]MBP2415065.1 8-oxo-dGTP pyrophosphatase MutT (NUDIX family) [Arthrobacter stackebrandtii]
MTGYVYAVPRALEFPVGRPLDLPVGLADEIERHWTGSKLRSPHIFDGEILNATSLAHGPGQQAQILLRPARFSHYLYGQANKLPSRDMCRSVAVNAVMKTVDNFYVLARMGAGSTFQRRIKFIGGAASPEDIRDGLFQPKQCLAREFSEELGLAMPDVAGEPFRPHFTTRPSFNILNVSYQLNLKVGRGALEEAANFASDRTSAGPAEVDELLFLESTEAGLAAFQDSWAGDCLDYVLPLLQALVAGGNAGPLREDMFR